MKKNHSVNIGGQLFNIDEDALRRLEEYFTRLRGYFGGNGDAAEMLADVEARIAELLIPLSRGSERVVDMAAIEAVIGQMGQPEEWGTPDEENGPEGSSTRSRSHRRIFRDTDRRILGGVASGLASWSGLDPLVIRVLFVLFSIFYFTGLIVYAVLWLVLPEARTTSEKLEMSGEAVNVDNLKRRFHEEKQRLADLGEHLPKNEDVRRFTRDFGYGLGRMARFGANLFLRMVGVVILLMVLALAIGLSVSMFVRDSFYFDGGLRFMNLNLFQISQYLLPQASLRWQLYLAVAVVSIALVGLLTYWGLKLLIQWKNSTWQIPSILALSLAGGLTMGAVFAFRYQEQTRSGQVKSYRFSLNETPVRKIRLNVAERSYPDRQADPGIVLATGEPAVGNEDFFEGRVNMSFRPALNDSASLSLVATARGKSAVDAMHNLQGIRYFWQMADSTLSLDPKFSVPLKQGYFQQEVEAVLYLPLSTELYIPSDDIYDIDYESFQESTERKSGWYRMTRQGLTQVVDTVNRSGNQQ